MAGCVIPEGLIAGWNLEDKTMKLIFIVQQPQETDRAFPTSVSKATARKQAPCNFQSLGSIHQEPAPLTQLKPARHQSLKNQVGIIPRLHIPESPQIRSAIMRQHILIIASIIHKQIGQITPITSRQRLNTLMDTPGSIMRHRIVRREKMACVESEPSLIDRLQA